MLIVHPIVGNGTIRISNYIPVDTDGTTVLEDNHVCATPTTTAGPVVVNPGTASEYSEFHFEGATDQTLDITIKKSNQSC